MAPQLTRAMIKHIIYETPDQHAFLKQINLVIEEKYNSDLGHCPHRPVDTRDIKVTGDMAYRVTTFLCMYCGQELEEVKTYRLKNPIPAPPRAS
jgi:hypothetical protein